MQLDFPVVRGQFPIHTNCLGFLRYQSKKWKPSIVAINGYTLLLCRTAVYPGSSASLNRWGKSRSRSSKGSADARYPAAVSLLSVLRVSALKCAIPKDRRDQITFSAKLYDFNAVSNKLPRPSRSPRRGLPARSIIRLYSPRSFRPRASPRDTDHSPWPPIPALRTIACDINLLTRPLPSGKG